MPEAGTTWSIEVDRELCMGSGMCIVYAPATFAHDEQTKAVVVDPAGDPLDGIRNAVQACPTSALRLVTHENDGNDENDEKEAGA
ncbi:MAG: ferredoxin [Actinomycetota bacterium]|jgi:ferredoxin|nr:ferredoxin [Actinomycetota bacterium]